MFQLSIFGAGIIINNKSSLNTLSNLHIVGKFKAHYTVMNTGYGILIKDFIFNTPAIHNPSFATKSRYTVFTNGVIFQPSLDQHAGINHQNLLDNIRLKNIMNPIFKHGGSKDLFPVAGAYNTFWNLFLEDFSKAEGLRGDAWNARIIGLNASKPLILNYHHSAYIEGINKPNMKIQSLYQYQLTKRTNLKKSILQ
ncbi:hypothetical protein L3081_21385 [Colwellia sp. MSW7]|uniref:Uncharacterized protein n=1 Tax=Colwellia maritima TaxID=2912588 RepID=A0ABS9X5I3_9GAMM|nr:hypothetical protein [Colwellia maritima]MCI2285481.1 hypothetical protein [Colwellia maritima]